MTRWIGVAILVSAWMFGGSPAIDGAAAMPLRAAVQMPATGTSTDVSARRRARHHARSADRPQAQLYYIDRPHSYTPAPFVPFNYGYVFWPRIFWWP
jgi:uncharacterized protein YbjT (DUF2867 family)